MSIHDFFGTVVDFARAPVASYGDWRQRIAFRKGLAVLISEPHRASDLGFTVWALKREMARPFWQPVLLRRGDEPMRDSVPVTTRRSTSLNRAVARHS